MFIRQLRSVKSSGSTALCTTALLALTLSSTAEAQTERRTLSGEHVAIYNIVGEVRLEPGSGRDVEVSVTMRGADAKRLRIDTRTVRGLPTLVIDYPEDEIVYRDNERSRWGSTDSRIREDGTWGSIEGSQSRRNWSDYRRIKVKGSGSGLEAWADIVVRVPDGRAVDAFLMVGSLSANGVRGDVRLDGSAARVTAERITGVLNVDAGSGGVTLRDIRGPLLDVDVGSGGITLEDVRSDRCTLDTGSGTVTGTNVSCADLSADSGSGGVRFTNASFSTVSVDVGSGGVSLDLTSSPRSVSVESGSGGVTLSLPDNVNATLDIETGSGGITTDFPIRTNRVERNSLRGTIGDGAGRISIETGSGSVRLKRRP
ncbi:MAG: DUF4097 family beta strand repeat protein [Gemmatimonadaceae bacterium]|nr:DUF4097 family beta strand repeat protein [Gemmatimonadaceae bacterium]